MLAAVAAGLQRDERALAAYLRAVSERHRSDPEVHHLALDLADWSDRHAADLEPWAGADVPAGPAVDDGSPANPSLQLLVDLRGVHRQACDVALAWELVGVTAQAAHDDDLQALAVRCHDEALRQARWAATLATQAAPQALLP